MKEKTEQEAAEALHSLAKQAAEHSERPDLVLPCLEIIQEYARKRLARMARKEEKPEPVAAGS